MVENAEEENKKRNKQQENQAPNDGMRFALFSTLLCSLLVFKTCKRFRATSILLQLTQNEKHLEILKRHFRNLRAARTCHHIVKMATGLHCLPVLAVTCPSSTPRARQAIAPLGGQHGECHHLSVEAAPSRAAGRARHAGSNVWATHTDTLLSSIDTPGCARRPSRFDRHFPTLRQQSASEHTMISQNPGYFTEESWMQSLLPHT